MKTDFADWLSPMLVKELRQGMRTKLFVSTFLILQGLMMFSVIMGLLTVGVTSDGGFGTGFFWTVISLPVLCILPFSGLGAVSNEMKANTLELLFLTRLSAWRIIAGKWFAIVAQTVLLVCAVLPYAALRYFTGGVNLADELLGLGLMLAGSALLSSISVGLSPYQTRFNRVFVVIGMIVFVQGVLPYIFMRGAFSISVTSGGSYYPLAALIPLGCVAVVLHFLMLEMGASKIAPPAENHAAKKRSLAFLLLLISIGATLWTSDARMLTALCGALALIVCLDALTEQIQMIPSIYRPFVRRGFLGRLLGRFLYPGWGSGLLCTVVLIGGFAALFIWHRVLIQNAHSLLFIAFCGALLVPHAIIRVFLPRTEKVLAFFIGIQMIFIAITLTASAVDEALKWNVREVISFIPTSALILAVSDTLPDDTTALFLSATGITTAVSLGVLLLLMVRSWAKYREMEALASATPAPDATLA